MYAHIAGIPIEEAALSFAPLAGLGLYGLIVAKRQMARLFSTLLALHLGTGNR